MKNINFHAIVSEFKKAMLGAVSVSLILALLISVVEPAVISAATTSSQFTISQTITGDISFVTAPTNVTMSPSLGGLTGGTSNGQTDVNVRTNDTAGYTLTITASSSSGMEGNATAGTIPALVTVVPGVPAFTFDTGFVGANKAYFGYTVENATTTHLNLSFLDNGSTTCGTGSTDTVNACWLAATTTAKTIVSTTGPVDNSTTTIKFRVVINANPSPSIPEDIYVATTTLTATTN